MNRPFAKKLSSPRLSPAEAERQGRVSKLALEAFGKTEAVIAFLNTHDDELGGRPIDLAIASPDGLAAVEAVLATRMSRPR